MKPRRHILRERIAQRRRLESILSAWKHDESTHLLRCGSALVNAIARARGSR